MAPAHTLLVLYSLNQARGEWSVGGAVQSATVAPTSLNLTDGGANAATGIRARFLRLYLADPSVYVVPSPNATEGPSPPPPPPTPLAPPYQGFVTTFPPPPPPAAPTPEMPLPPGLPMFALRELSVNSCALSEAAVAPTC